MSDIFEHAVFNHRMKFTTLEKRVENVFTVLALKAQMGEERDVVLSVYELIDRFGARAGAVYLCAYRIQKFGCGESLKLATEIIYDLTYDGYYKEFFDDESKREVRRIFDELRHWISFVGSYPVYFNKELLKRNTMRDSRNQKWYEDCILSYLTVDEKLSLANMVILNCVKNVDDLSTSEQIAIKQTKVKIFDEYYALCDKYKVKASKDELKKMRELGKSKSVV